MIIIALSTGATAWLLDPAIDKIFLDKDESMLLLIPIAIILTLLIKSIATYIQIVLLNGCLLYTSPSPRDKRQSRMPSSA